MGYKVGQKFYSSCNEVCNDLKRINNDNYSAAKYNAIKYFNSVHPEVNAKCAVWIGAYNSDNDVVFTDCGYGYYTVSFDWSGYAWHTDSVSFNSKYITGSTTSGYTNTTYTPGTDIIGNDILKSSESGEYSTTYNYETLTNKVKWVEIDGYNNYRSTIYIYYKVRNTSSSTEILDETNKIIDFYKKRRGKVKSEGTVEELKKERDEAIKKAIKPTEKFLGTSSLIYLLSVIAMMVIGIIINSKTSSLDGYSLVIRPFHILHLIYAPILIFSLFFDKQNRDELVGGVGKFVPILIYISGLYIYYHIWGSFIRGFCYIVYAICILYMFVFNHISDDRYRIRFGRSQYWNNIIKHKSKNNGVTYNMSVDDINDMIEYEKKGGYNYYLNMCEKVKNM